MLIRPACATRVGQLSPKGRNSGIESLPQNGTLANSKNQRFAAGVSKTMGRPKRPLAAYDGSSTPLEKAIVNSLSLHKIVWWDQAIRIF
jgi:hypothetical protein